MNMQMSKKLAVTLFAALAAFGAWAVTENVNGIEWTYWIVDGKAEISGIPTTTSGAITIPSTLGGCPVTSIGADAFEDCSGLTSVTIPDGVTTIGDYAFYGCSGLTSVTIGNGVTSIGRRAFYGCSGLAAVHIKDLAAWCRISFSRSSYYDDDSDDYYFDYSNPLVRAHNLYLNGSLVNNLMIPDGVTTIGDYAFYGCSGLTSVTIPDSVTSIGDYAFYECSRLTSVTISDSVTGIGYGAFEETPFYDNQSDGLVVLGRVAYKMKGACPDSVTIPDSVAGIGDGAFYGCRELASVTIPDGVTSIGDYAFYECSCLCEVIIPDSVTSIGNYAFADCYNLQSIGTRGLAAVLEEETGEFRVFARVPDGVTSIGNGAFSGCMGLWHVTIGNGVKSIGDGAFSGCSGLMGVTIPDGVVSIGDYAFADCEWLSSVTTTDIYTDIYDTSTSIVTIPDSVTIADSVTSIGERAFSSCRRVTSVTIGDGVTSIGNEAFSSCYWLTSVMIGNGVTNIGEGAFLDCCWLTNAIMPRISFDESVFDGCNENLKIRYWDELSCRLTLKPSSTKYGTVSGGGKYTARSMRTIKAKAKSGYVFAGWFTDKACKKALNPDGYDNRNPTVKIVMPASDTTIYAKFVTKAADKKALKFSSATKKLAKTPAKATAGDAFSLKLGISSASLPTFAAKGLPKGLSVNKTTGEITGKATKPGSYTATITVTDAAGNKITQKVKFRVSAPSWATGTFYGTARPDGKTAAYLQFTVGSTGKVSGKVNYKGKAYSFASAYTSCTATKATFAPSVKVGSSTFKPGTVTVKTQKMDGLSIVEASNAKGSFAAQKKPNLVKKGKALAALVGKTFTFTKKDANSGLTKSKDKLSVKLGSGDVAKVSGTVKGKALKALSWALLLSDKEPADGATTYTLYVDIIDAALKYEKTLVITATVGPGGTTADAAFAEE